VNDIALPTQEQARALTDRIKIAVEGTWQLIREAYTSRTWAVLGYDTWDAYCTSEFGETRLKLPREERQEIVSSLRESGLSVRAIASATGVGVGTVHRELSTSSNVPNGTMPARVMTTDGRTYPASITEEVVDAELVDEPVTPKVKRRPLPEAFTDAGRDLTRAAERLARLAEDDRFPKNRENTHHQVPELLGALDHTVRLVEAMDLPAASTSEEARRWWATSLRNVSDALSGIADSLEKEQ
jgi:transposase-like protein